MLETKYWARWTADPDCEDISCVLIWHEQLPQFRKQFQKKHTELYSIWYDSVLLGSWSLPIWAMLS